MTRTAADVVRDALNTGHERLVTALDGVEGGEHDAVHQVRVAARGLRSDLRVFRDLLDADWVAILRDELSWLADACGPARDLEVVGDWLAGVEGDPGLPFDAAARARIEAEVAKRRRAGDRKALRAARSRRAKQVVALVASAPTSAPFNDEADEPAARVLDPHVRKAWRRYAKAARRLVADPEIDAANTAAEPADDDAAPESADDPASDQAWHDARVRAKRARYAARSASSVLASERVESAAKGAQTHIGHHQDRVVAAEVLTEIGMTSQDAAVAFTAGRLAELARQQRLDVRKTFKRPKKKPPGMP